MNLSFDCALTVAGYEKSKKDMNSLTVKVHEEVFFGEFFAKNSKKVERAISDIAVGVPHIAKTAFIGQLTDRIEHLPISKGLTEFDRELVRIGVAGVITSILIDNGSLKVFEEPKAVIVKGRRVLIPIKYVVLGGEPTVKSSLYGYSIMPGQLYTKRAGNLKMNSEIKSLLKEGGSIPFEVSSYMTRELVMKMYSLMDDYYSETLEAGASKRKRYGTYADAIVELSKWHQFYLPMKADGRYRLYYEAQLAGIRPQGKLAETLMIDSAVPQIISDSGADHIRHIIYVLRYGRCTKEFAIANYTNDDFAWAAAQDPMDLEYVKDGDAIDVFGERILANKAAAALDLYRLGLPSKFMFGKDLTNSGLLMASTSFRSTKMMVSANLLDGDTTYDSHTDFGDGYNMDLDRSTVKGIHMALLHGSTNKTITHMIAEATGTEDVTEADVAEGNRRAYGDCVDNIDAIASWGSMVVDSYCTKLTWKTPDHLVAQHNSVMEHVPVVIYSASNNEKGFVKDTIVKTMPLAVDAKGIPIYQSGAGKGIHSRDGVQVKVRGLYANITHSLDGYLLRRIMRRLLASGQPFMLKHDDYMVMPSSFDTVLDECLVFFKGATKMNYYQRTVDEIAQNLGKRVGYVPKIILGDYDCEKLVPNFLMP